MGVELPKTPKNDLLFSLLYEAMLKNHEARTQNQQKLLMNKTNSFKRKHKTKRNKGGASCKTICFYCIEKGHCKRNCLKYLADKKNGSSDKGI